MKERRRPNRLRNVGFLALSLVLFIFGLGILWVASLKIPDLSSVDFLGMNGHSLLLIGLIVVSFCTIAVGTARARKCSITGRR